MQPTKMMMMERRRIGVKRKASSVKDMIAALESQRSNRPSTLKAECDWAREMTWLSKDCVEVRADEVRYHDRAFHPKTSHQLHSDRIRDAVVMETLRDHSAPPDASPLPNVLLMQPLHGERTAQDLVRLNSLERLSGTKASVSPGSLSETSGTGRPRESHVLVHFNVARHPQSLVEVERPNGDGPIPLEQVSVEVNDVGYQDKSCPTMPDGKKPCLSKLLKRRNSVDYHDLVPSAWGLQGQEAKHVDMAAWSASDPDCNELGKGLGIILDKLKNIETKLDEIKTMEQSVRMAKKDKTLRENNHATDLQEQRKDNECRPEGKANNNTSQHEGEDDVTVHSDDNGTRTRTDHSDESYDGDQSEVR